MPRTKTEKTPRPRDPPGKPILRKSAYGTSMRAPKGAPSLLSSTYASSPAASGASTRELIRQASECTIEEDTEKQAPGAEVVAEEEAEEEEDSGEWISSSLWETVADADRPLPFYKDFITAPADQKWKLILAREWLACTDHNGSGFFFYGAPLEVMGVRIPLSDFHMDVLDWLRVAPSLRTPGASFEASRW